MITQIVTPTIHLNGTSREALFDSYCQAIDALHAAGSKLAGSAPNGRDYYPQGNGAINAAMDQHADRMNRLTSIIKELELIAEAVS